MNIFSENSVLGRFLNWAADIVLLNIMWLICSLPIITIGASTTALYYAMMKRQRRDEGYVHTNFLQSFKNNFKQSTIIWIIFLVIGIILSLDYRIGMYATVPFMGKFMMITSILLMIPYGLTLLYIFPVQAKFENTIKDNLKNALLMSVAHFGYTILIILFLVGFIACGFISKVFLGVLVLTGFSLYAFLTGNIYIMVFRKHLPNELAEDAEASGMDKMF